MSIHADTLMSDGSSINNDEAVETLKLLVEHLKPSLRDIERMLTYFALIENSLGIRMESYYQDIMATICFMNVANPRLLDAVISKRAGSQELLEFLQMSEGSNYSEKYAIEHLAAVIEFDLASEERRKVMQDTRLVEFRFGRLPSQVFDYFYRLLNNIQPVR